MTITIGALTWRNPLAFILGPNGGPFPQTVGSRQVPPTTSSAPPAAASALAHSATRPARKSVNTALSMRCRRSGTATSA
eukprot:scaffold14477_cov130-Isochrysis_galbana.AAC.3